MVFTSSGADSSAAASPESSRGAFSVRSEGSLGGSDRSPCPPPHTSRGRMQTPSAAVSREGSAKRGGAQKMSAKSDSPSSCRMMTQSASRGASPPVSAGKSRRSGADNFKSAAATYHQPLNAESPDCVRAPSVSRGHSDLPSNLSFFRSIDTKGKSVERYNLQRQ